MALRDFLLLALVCLFWGLNFVVSKWVIEDTPPLFYAALRFGLIALVLAPWLFPAPRQMGRVIAVGLLMGGLNFAFLFLGLKLSEPSAAAVTVQLGVPFTTILSMIFLGETIGWRRAAGIALAFIVATELGFEGRSLPVLLLGATVTGVVGVLCVQWMLRFTRLREDAAIGAVLSVFFGAGVVGLSYIQTMRNGTAGGLDHFIYGQTAALSERDAVLMGAIALLAGVATLLLLKEFSLVCFNDAFAKVTGWPVSVIDLLMMALVVLVIVAGLQAVGLILVVAMLIIPPVSARFWTERVRWLVVISGAIGAACGYLGSTVSALAPRQPAGAVIVLTSGVVFVASMTLAPRRGVIAVAWRRLIDRIRIAGEHLLEEAYERRGAGATLTRDEVDAVSAVRGWSRVFRRVVMGWLRATGRARWSEGVLRLSPEGVADGARVSRNHALWERYLVSHADIAPSHVDWSVDQVEHVLPDELIVQLEDELRRDGVAVPAHGGAAS